MTDANQSRPSLDAELEKEIADALGDASLEQMMDETDVPADKLAAARATESDAQSEPAAEAASAVSRNTRVGTVVGVKGDDVFIDLGAKDQGVCPVSLFGPKPPRVGEHIEFIVQSYDEADGLHKLVLPGSTVKADWATLAQGMIVEAMVTGMNTGGLELKIAGHRAFMPVSQIDTQRVEDLTPYLNHKLRCKVTELNKRKRRIVLSRRAVLQEEEAVNRESLLQEIEPGQVREGTVRSVQKFGAFVELAPGIDGLVHVSDMAWTRVEDPTTFVQPGQKVNVQVLKISEGGKRISLGMKQTQPDPWSEALGKFQVGMDVQGKVTRLADFGAFVELEPGVEGLVHISQLSHERVNRVEQVLKPGQEIKARIVQVEPEKKRIGLSIKALTAAEQESRVEKPSHDDMRRYVTREKKSYAGESLGALLSKFSDPNADKGRKGGIG